MAFVLPVDLRAHQYDFQNIFAVTPDWSGGPIIGSNAHYCCVMDWVFLGNVKSRGIMSAVIIIQNLTLGYDKRLPAVHKVDTKIHEGSLTAIVGPNGAGKSTLLKGMIGNLLPFEGDIQINKLNMEDIAYLPQQSSLDLTFPICVFELVAMGLWNEIGAFGSVDRTKRKRIEAAIAVVGLTGFEERSISTLSGGQMQRVLFARLLLQDAKLILLDEPFTAIDTKTTSDLIRIIQEWHYEKRTVLAVLHDQDIVHTHFPQSLLLARQLVAHGPTDQVITSENLHRARQMCEACLSTPHICGKSAA